MASPAERSESMLERALAYVDEGRPVFPVCSPAFGKHRHGEKACSSPGKVPMVAWQDFQERIPSKVELELWWRRWPEANIGMATGQLSGTIVLDCDGAEARKEAIRRGVPKTRAVWTGKPGGIHYHLEWPGEPVRNFTRKLPGLDFRGDGGYVLLPPSLHASGARYRWVEGAEAFGTRVAPTWLLDLLKGRVETTEPGGREILRLEDVLAGIPDGERNDKLFRFACKLRGDAVDLRYAEWMVAEAARRARPPYDEVDPVELVRRAFREYPAGRGVVSPNGKLAPGEIPIDGVTARELLAMEFSPTKWVVPGLVPEGGTLLSGKTKLGKSWLMLQVALAVAAGEVAFGKIRCPAGRVLYLALEDGKRRIQDRLRKLLGEAECPERLHIYTEWPRFDDEDRGLEAVMAFLREHPDTVLIVVDTLKMVRPKEDSRRRIYDLDYEAVAPATQLAQRERIGLVMVHHNNKLRDVTDLFDMISGSTGLTGGVDTGLVLRRESGQADASLGGRGRDLEELDLALRWGEEGYGWTLLGDMEDHRVSAERRAILEIIQKEPGLRPKEIADLVDRKYGTVKRLLFSMAHDGQVRVREGGRYFAAVGIPVTDAIATSVTPVTLNETATNGDDRIDPVIDTEGRKSHTSVTGNRTATRDPRDTTVSTDTTDTRVTEVTASGKEDACPICDRIHEGDHERMLALAEKWNWPKVSHANLTVGSGERTWRGLYPSLIARALAALEDLERDDEEIPI